MFENIEPYKVSLVAQDENGNIFQLGLTEEQSSLLNAFVASMSKEKSLIRLPKEYDLILKEQK